MLHFIGAIITLYLALSDSAYWDDGDNLWMASLHLSEVAEVFISLTDAAIIIALALLDRGIAIVQTGGNPTRGSKIVVIVAICVASFMALLWVSSWAMAVAVNSLLRRDSVTWNMWAARFALRVMRLIFWIAATGATLMLVVRSVLAAIRKGVEPGAQTVSNPLPSCNFHKQVHEADRFRHSLQATYFFLACSGVYIIRPIYHLYAWSAAFHGELTGEYRWAELWDGIVTVIIGLWPMIVSLILLFFLGRKQLKGLWSDGRYAAEETRSAQPKNAGEASDEENRVVY